MKRIIRISSLAVMLILVAASAFAATGPSMCLQEAYMDESGKLNILLYTSVEDSLQVNDFSVLLDQQALPAENIQNYGASGLGTTWFFLVDTSTVSISDGWEPITKLMPYLIKLVGSADNAMILTTGSRASEIELVNKAETLEKMFNSLKQGTNTALNATIGEVLQFAQNNETVKPRACMVIISNGENSDATGMTTQELREGISQSDVTVYTVAFKAKQSNAEKVKAFGSIARASSGGAEISVENGSKDVLGIFNEIFSNESRFRIVTTDPVGQRVYGEKLEVTLSKDAFQLTDSMLLNGAEQDAIRAAIDDLDSFPNTEQIVGILLIALAFIVLIVWVKTRKKHGRPKSPKHDLGLDDPVSSGWDVTVPDDRSPRIWVTLSRIGSEAKYTAEMTDNLIVGREPSMARMVIPDDPKISGKHLIVSCHENVMIVKDCSRNGTKINDIKISQPTQLHQQDVLTMGTTQLRITWQIDD